MIVEDWGAKVRQSCVCREVQLRNWDRACLWSARVGVDAAYTVDGTKGKAPEVKGAGPPPIVVARAASARGAEGKRVSKRIKELTDGNKGLAVRNKTAFAYALYYPELLSCMGIDVQAWGE